MVDQGSSDESRKKNDALTPGDEGPKPIDYMVSIKLPYLVVSFLGAMTRHSGPVFEKCFDEIVASNAQFVVLSFQDVPAIERPSIPAFVKFQKSLRDHKLELRLCRIRPELRALLTDVAAVRGDELKNNLQEALQTFSVKK